MGVDSLSKIILKDQRQYFIDKVKASLMKAIIILARRYPEPTKQNTFHPNSHVWIDILGKFLEMEDNPSRERLFEGARNVWVGEHETDPYYRDREQVIFELWLEEVLKGNWKPRSLDHPSECWKVDPNIRGKGYEFLAERYYHKEKYNVNSD